MAPSILAPSSTYWRARSSRRGLVFTLVAGGRVDAADRAGGAARRIRLRAVRVPGTPRCSTPWRSCRSCCRRWSSAAAFLALLGPRSPFGLRLDHTIWAILIAHVFYNYAVVLRIVGGVWAQLDPRAGGRRRASLAPPAGRPSARVTLPLLRPAIASAASIVFLFTFTSFGVILILGGPRFATLEVEIYRQAAQLLDLRVAATLALLQLLVLGGAAARLRPRTNERGAVQRRRQVAARRPAARRGQRRARFVVANAGRHGRACWACRWPCSSSASLVTGSDGYGLGNYIGLFATRRCHALFVPPIDAIGNSLRFAVDATAISTAAGPARGHVIAHGRGILPRVFDALLTLPLGTSAVIVGFGFLVVARAQLPVDLRMSPLLIPIAHALVALPFVVRAVVPVMRSIDRAFTKPRPSSEHRRSGVAGIDLPIIGRAPLVGAGFAFAVSLGRVRGDAVHRPARHADHAHRDLPAARPAGRRSAFGQAMAMATVLMLSWRLPRCAIDRIRLRRASACCSARARGVTVRFGDDRAVDGIDLEVA